VLNGPLSLLGVVGESFRSLDATPFFYIPKAINAVEIVSLIKRGATNKTF
jgi:hypothetical protein